MKHFLISDRNENTSAPSTSGGIEATRSMKTRRKVLQDLGILSAFRAILHVPNISQAKHLMVVLERSSVFSKDDLSSIYHKIHGHRVRSNISHHLRNKTHKAAAIQVASSSPKLS
ncbi:vesicle-fusing ATPase 1-like isoform X2 [Cryptotermes secundus]|uniref:vesicle-fusing ATPase 1-like isoform X2 n=1 Tax=Cryptotermes secundus TaxID=105785 RepID=UPI000CD7AF96|nr:vesicle-fusing ATPase 1-like isoform X2 [Cryptotermes secundus]